MQRALTPSCLPCFRQKFILDTERLSDEVPAVSQLSTPSPQSPRAGRISVKLHRHVCLIHTEDAVLAEELLSRRQLAEDILARLTDQVLLIKPGRVPEVLEELQRMGHRPRVMDGSPMGQVSTLPPLVEQVSNLPADVGQVSNLPPSTGKEPTE